VANSYTELMEKLREREEELSEWRTRFRALVGGGRPDTAGNAVIHLRSEAKKLEERCAVLADKFDRAEARAREVSERCAALHRNTDRPSLRDHFAAAALTGLLARGPHGGHESAAKLAYEQADAMLARRAVVKP
jgi:hypothetical protein